MAKRRKAIPETIPSGANQANMMKLLQKIETDMQADMQAAREALAHETVEVSVGGGAVTVVITGHQRVQAITINKDMIDTSDDEWLNDLQDMLVVAANQAIERSQIMAAERMEAIAGGLGGLPGLGRLLGLNGLLG